MVIWIRNGIMVIENFCTDRYLWDPGVLVQFRTAIKPMVISIFPPEMPERIREHKTKFDSMRRELATTSKPTINTKKHKYTDGLGLFKNQRIRRKAELCLGALGRLSFYILGLWYKTICRSKMEHRKPFYFLALFPNHIVAESTIGHLPRSPAPLSSKSLEIYS